MNNNYAYCFQEMDEKDDGQHRQLSKVLSLPANFTFSSMDQPTTSESTAPATEHITEIFGKNISDK